MGITLLVRMLREPCLTHVALALSCLTLIATIVRAEPRQGSPGTLTHVMNTLDELIADRMKTSATYQAMGKLLPFGIDYPVHFLSRKRPTHKSIFDKHLQHLTFHAVCKERRVALTKLFELETLFLNSFFNEAESIYLEKISFRLSLKLPFHGVNVASGRPLNEDLRMINLRRRVVHAFDDGQPQEALLLLRNFSRLCSLGR
ncbi:MAG: hypothetical protein ACR2PA_12345 [Hyphomicrobiaceae bacterium]